jgi:hypothetical protein
MGSRTESSGTGQAKVCHTADISAKIRETKYPHQKKKKQSFTHILFLVRF